MFMTSVFEIKYYYYQWLKVNYHICQNEYWNVNILPQWQRYKRAGTEMIWGEWHTLIPQNRLKLGFISRVSSLDDRSPSSIACFRSFIAERQTSSV